MANQDIKMRVQYSAEFDTSQITKGLQEIKKQITSSNISEELKKKLQDSFNKVEINLPKLDKFMKKEDFNLKELAEYQKLVQEITKDMTNFSKVANEADFTKNFSEQDTARLKKFDEQIKQVDDKLKATKKEIIKTFSDTEQGKIGGKSNKALNGVIEQLLNVPEDQIENKLNEIIKETENQTENARDKLQEVFEKSSRGKNLKAKGIIDLLFGENSGVTMSEAAKDRLTKDNGVYAQFDKIRQEILTFTKDTPIEDVEKTLKSLSGFINEFFNVPEGQESILGSLLPKEVIERIKTLATDIPGLKTILGKDKLQLIADGEAEKLRLTQEQAEDLKKTIEELTEKGIITRTEADNLVKKFTGLGGAIEDTTESAKHLDNQQKALNATFGSLANRITNSISALTIFNRSIQIVRQAVNSVRELDAAFTQIAIVSEQSNEQAWQMFDSFNKLAKQYSITTKDLTEGAKLFYQQGLNAADTMKMVEASTVSAALGEVTMTEAANTLTAAIQGYNESAAVAMEYTDKIAMVGAVSAADFNELSTAMEKTASSAYTAGIDFDHLLGYLGKMIEVTREAPANLGTAMKTIIARFEDMKKDPMAILEDGVTANKVEAALATIGIALRNSEGEFRALQDVMDELGMKWQSLTRNQQAYIATVAAGSRQQSRFLALMNNYDRTMELVAESQNSAGAAAKQYAVYQDSAAAATARLTAAWEEFYTKIVNSEQIIWVLDRLKDLVEIMSEVGPVVSAIGASLGALGIQTVLKGVIPTITKNFAEAAVAGQAANVSILGLVKGGGALLLTFGKVIAVVAAISAVVWLAIKAFNALDKALHKDRETINNLTKEIQESNKKIEEYGKSTKGLEKLMERYDELNEKVYRSKEEQEELNDVINQINENSERAIVSIDKNGDAHLNNAKSVEKEIEAKKELAKFEAEQKYRKQQEIIEKYDKGNGIEVTADQAREANLEDLAKYIEFENDEQVKNYRKLQEYLDNNDFNIIASNEFSKLLGQTILPDEQNRINSLGQQYGLKDDNITFDDIKSQIEKEYKDRLKEYETEGLNFDEAQSLAGNEYREKIMEAINGYVKAVYQDEASIIEKYSNEDFKTELYENADRESLIQKYQDLANFDKRYSILIDIFEKTGMTANKFEDFIGNEEDFLKDYSDALEEYANSDKTTDDIQKLVDALTKGKKNIADSLSNWIDEAIKQSFTSHSEKAQFVKDNQNLFVGNTDASLSVYTGSITNDELSKMKELAKTTEFEDNEKFSLFKLFEEDDTQLNDLLNQYLKKVSEGLYQDADIVKQAIIDLLASKDITGPAAEKLANFFVPDYQSAIEKRLGNAKDNYKTAQSIYDKDPQESLDDKEYEFLKQQDKNIDRYIAINEEGEKYLSILGKIAILENSRNEYVNSLNLKIKDNNNSLEIEKNNLEEAQQKVKDQEEGAENLVELAKQRINELEQENNLLEQQVQVTDDILNKTMSISLKENLSQAEQTYDNINKIGKALGEAQQNAGQLSLATAQSLLAMDDAYYKYMDIVDGMIQLDTDGANKMMENEKAKYDTWLDAERKKLDEQISIYEAENQIIEQYFTEQNEFAGKSTEEKLELLKTELGKKEEQLNNINKANVDANKQGLIENADYLTKMDAQWSDYYANQVKANNAFKKGLASAGEIQLQSITQFLKGVKDNSKNLNASVDIKVDQIDWNEEDVNKVEQQIRDKFNANLKRIEILQGVRDNLKDLSPVFKEAFDKGVSEAVKGGEKAVKDFSKVIDDLADALKDLDKLLKDIRRDLKDITIDYNPFTDLFEAWEAEWDYYYNIKNLIKQLETQSTYIDNIISADYTSAREKLDAYDAKVGNITGKIAANDAYITTLRAGIAKQAKELESEFNQYYNVDNRMGGWQIFQRDTTLGDWEKTINEVKRYSYELSKLINTQENELNLLEANQEALEQERSAYESILSTVDSLIDSLSGNEDITVDLSDLEGIKVELQAAIDNESVENIKEQIRDLNDYIQELNVKLDLNDNVINKGLEEGYERLKDEIDDLQDLIDTLNEKIAEQQELLQQLSEIYTMYVDTAIDTQQELYDAIVEQYQDEINEKKKQYDYLKQLDNDYLKAVKDNIDKERKAREDANKQQDFQRNLQRAQLLQQDTSGAYRNELANLNKEIENQRQDLYDDLVDKQVEALEKEIEKRHELYDLEVSAMEERLAYMQENAILLWEMVNDIVSRGSEEMMATLENTTDYINQNELAKERQRRQWELNTQTTYKGVIEGEIDMLQRRIDKAKEELDAYEELQDAIELSTATYSESQAILQQENAEFQQVMNEFMQVWTTMTSDLTGYNESWAVTLSNIRMAMEKDIQALDAMGDEGGSIFLLNDKLKQLANEMYDDFLRERESYRDSLSSMINEIEARITAAIDRAANTIQDKANNIRFNDVTVPSGGGIIPTSNDGSTNSIDPGGGSPEKKKRYGYVLQIQDMKGNQPISIRETNFDSLEEANQALEKIYNERYKYAVEHNILRLLAKKAYSVYLKGGFADFTGPAWLDGTKSQPEAVLNAKQTKLFTSMVSSLERTAANNSNINSALGSSYNIGDINTNINVEKLDNETDIDRVARQVENRIMKSIRNRVVVSVA